MTLGVYSVVDSKTGIYAHPFYSVTNGAAIRSFVDACADKDSPFARHPEDYCLVHLGWFDDQRGSFDTKLPEVLITAVNAIVEA